MTLENIVSYALGDGGDSGFFSPSHVPEKMKTYRMLKSSRSDDYETDVVLDYSMERDDVVLHISCRADGTYHEGENHHIELFRYSSSQPGFFSEESDASGRSLIRALGYLYCYREKVKAVGMKLTWYHSSVSSAVSSVTVSSREELKQDFDRIIDVYIVWAKKLRDMRNVRDDSIKGMPFPYPEKRKGQDEFISVVDGLIHDGKRGFIQAPTGIGKTTGSIYPAVKALGEGHVEKIFFLTARTISRTVAEHAFDVMRSSGCKIKTVTLTAKEKICALPENYCRPEKCPYARGYHDRVERVLEEMLRHDHFSRDLILAYADKHQLCPFELSLDLSLLADGIICDYNYVFDPGVYLKRYFEGGKGEYVFLVDEAHNLIDRAREMFSAELRLSDFKEIRKIAKKSKVADALEVDDILKYFKTLMRECAQTESTVLVRKKQDKDLVPAIKQFQKSMEDIIDHEENRKDREALMDLYFSCLKYLRVSESFDDSYVCYMGHVEGDKKDFFIRLFCLDPSVQLRLMMGKGRASLFFSATLSPMEYFTKLLGGQKEDQQLAIPSPFPKDNLALLVADKVSTRYSSRDTTAQQVAQMIHAVVSARKGNYIAYFPSYRYLETVSALFRNLYPDCEVLKQVSRMGESAKEDFLKQFSSDNPKTLLGFAVLGGMFGESIDLTGERLSGAIIVGVGLPQICTERDIIKAFFEEKYDQGFEYAYIYPGMNKVLQAAGRVIRTEKDRGVVLLIDDRYGQENYRTLFPAHWPRAKRVQTLEEISTVLSRFW